MIETPKGLRTHIAILGRRNAGKSALINAIANQQVAIVADKPGTTTDPVEKVMELKPLGPVVIIDTAGMDDPGALGSMRVERSAKIMRRADLAILVTDGDLWENAEKEISGKLLENKIPFVVVRNKQDKGSFENKEKWLKDTGLPEKTPVVDISADKRLGLDNLLNALAAVHKEDADKPLLADLVPPSGVIVLVVPLDSGAPKGRLILPQVQAIRDSLDGRLICVITTEMEYPEALAKLKSAPSLVVCDSQVIHKVAAQTPENIPLTTFSILMARFKGNLESFAKGAAAINSLKPGDSVMIQEACSHHPQKDDIGRIKIPRLLTKKAGGDLQIQMSAGKELAEYPDNIKVIVHCGACVITQGQMETRQQLAESCSIPMTNYGMTISLCQGVLERVLGPFPEALAAYKKGT